MEDESLLVIQGRDDARDLLRGSRRLLVIRVKTTGMIDLADLIDEVNVGDIWT